MADHQTGDDRLRTTGELAAIGIVLLALAVGFILMKDVLAQDEGTPKMIEIATAIQEGAWAYLKRQFRTIGIDRVLFMVAHASDPYRWDDSTAALGQADDLLEGMAALLVRACDQLLAQGLLRSYRRIERDGRQCDGNRVRHRQQRDGDRLRLLLGPERLRAGRSSSHHHDNLLRPALRAARGEGERARGRLRKERAHRGGPALDRHHHGRS